MILVLIGLIVAYLIGSVPTAFWVGKRFYNIDVREHGSGNSGATNTFRVLGKKAGIPVLLIDILKGIIVVKLTYFFGMYEAGSLKYVNYQILLGISGLVGHIFPLYAGFRGGKGIATLLGITIALHPPAALICMGIFIVLLLLSKIVSISSILTSISFSLLIVFYFKETNKSLIFFSIVMAVLVIITHKKNIKRMLKGEESKAEFLIRKKKTI